MAEKISVEIGLEGGAEVQRQLEDIGRSGQQAFSDIQTAAEQMDFSTISDGFQNIGETGVQAFDKVKTAAQNAAVFEQIIVGVKKVEGAFESLGNAAIKMGARMTRSLGPIGVFARALGPLGIALAVVGGAFVKFGNDTAKTLASLTGDAAKLGLTAQQLDKLQQALTRTGVSSDAILPGLQKFRESLGADFTGDVTAAFQRFVAQLERMPDSVQRTQLAMATLGDSLGAQVIAGLQTGTLNAQNFATALGAITPATQAQINQANQYQQALNQLSAAWAELKGVFTPIATPVFQFITAELQALKADIKEIIAEFRLLVAVWNLLTAPAGQQAAAAQRVKQAYDLLGQAGQQAGQQIAQAGQTAVQAWQQGQLAVGPFGQTLALTGQGGAQAGQQIAGGMNTANQALQSTATQANATTQAVQQVKAPEISTWQSWENAVIGALKRAIDKLLEWIGLKDKAGASGGGGGGGGAPGKARGGLIGGRGSGTSDSNLAWLSRGEFVISAAAVRKFGAGVFAALNAGRIPGFAAGGAVGFQAGGLVAGSLGATLEKIATQFTQALRENTQILNLVLQKVTDLGQGMISLAQGMAQMLDQIAGLRQDVNTLGQVVKLMAKNQAEARKNVRDAHSDGGSISDEDIARRRLDEELFGFARGGLLLGRGTGTSDSNLARLSHGEFVISAAAVRRFGASFFATLNAGMLPGFALGGLVPRPAFAGGGGVGSMNHVTIQFPGVPPVGGLRASSAVVEELQRSAALAQVRSGGRKPSRYS